MSPLQALELALFNERRLLEFFKQQIDNGLNQEIRLLADEFLTQEIQLTAQMDSWREQLENDPMEHIEDFDPPNVPE